MSSLKNWELPGAHSFCSTGHSGHFAYEFQLIDLDTNRNRSDKKIAIRLLDAADPTPQVYLVIVRIIKVKEQFD